MEWADEVCLQLINLYKLRPILWDPTDPQYKMVKKKIDFWTEISKELNLNVNEVRKKMDSLLASYRRERQREASSGRSGVGTDEIYRSKWYAFEEMKFLNDKFKPRITKDTVDVSNFIFFIYRLIVHKTVYIRVVFISKEKNFDIFFIKYYIIAL